MKQLKYVAKRAINATGYELRRLHPKWNPAFQLHRSLQHFGVDLILDVGANAGQSSAELRTLGYDARIVSFEPLSDAHRQLVRAASHDARWIVHPRCALGDYDGTTVINISGNSVSSSLRPMLDAHRTAAAASGFVGSESVPIHRLDTVAPVYLRDSGRPFLKVDTQGFEKQVLAGARETLERMIGVHCELSLLPLYEGQALWDELRADLERAGFTLWSLHPGFTDPESGRTLQVDATFFRLPPAPERTMPGSA